MNLSEKDLNYVWHPYTPQKNMLRPVVIASGKGSMIIDEAGNEYIDAISSWWVTVHGHAHPYIAKKIYGQAKTLEQVIFAGFTHQPAIRLAGKLLRRLPKNFAKIFYSDNGSTAVEVAIKMALQYEVNNGGRKKNIIALKDSYHGDTFGAMSASSRSIFTQAFDEKLFDVIFIDKPTKENIHQIKNQLTPYKNTIACFIYEPLVQGAGGMKMFDPKIFDELMSFMKQEQIICIADEVMTGFYRTGKMFASEYLATSPDIICLSKGLTGGTMALGVTACTQHIYDAFISDEPSKTFFHGHSFTANPIACTAALASLKLFQKKKCRRKIEEICSENKKFTAKLRQSAYHREIKNVRQTGTIIAFEVITNHGDSYLDQIRDAFTPYCLQHGVYLRSLGNTIYIMPPYCIKKAELKKVYQVIEMFLNEPG